MVGALSLNVLELPFEGGLLALVFEHLPVDRIFLVSLSRENGQYRDEDCCDT